MKIKNFDVAEKYFYQRPSSSWVLAGVPNVEIKIYRIRSILIGAGIVTLTKYITNSSSIISLTHRCGYKKISVRR